MRIGLGLLLFHEFIHSSVLSVTWSRQMDFVRPRSTHPSRIAPVGSVLSNLANILSLKKHQRTALTAFVGGNYVFALLPTGFGTSIKMTDKWFIQSYRPMQGFLIRPRLLKHLSNGAIPDGWVEVEPNSSGERQVMLSHQQHLIVCTKRVWSLIS